MHDGLRGTLLSVHADKGTNARLFRAGLTLAKDRAAHQRAIEIHDRLFKRTRTSLAINAWDVIDDSVSHYHSSFAPTYEFVSEARNRMGAKLVLQNNGTGVDANPDHGTPETSHFAYLASVAGPKGFQTRTLARLGGTEEGLFRTLDLACRWERISSNCPPGSSGSPGSVWGSMMGN